MNLNNDDDEPEDEREQYLLGIPSSEHRFAYDADVWVDDLPVSTDFEDEVDGMTMAARKSILGQAHVDIDKVRSEVRRKGMSREELERRTQNHHSHHRWRHTLED
jgi:hypothetical protein